MVVLIKEFLYRLQRKRLLGSFFSNTNAYNTPILGAQSTGKEENNKESGSSEQPCFIITNSPSSKYVGHTSRFKKVFGIKNYKNGTRYVGQWKDNRKNGFGTLKSVNGNVYKGEFLNDRQHGYGYLLQLNGKIYEGAFQEDNPHGLGLEKSYDKSSYSGTFLEGRKHGIGKLIENNGNIYEGEFDQNLKSGFGIQTFKDCVYKGEWENNSMHGYGEIYHSDGKIYVGFHKKDKKHGFGFFLWKDGRTFVGNWRAGKQHGLGKYIVEGLAKFGLWVDGERISWYNNKEEAFAQIQIDDEYTKFYKMNRQDVLDLLQEN